MAEEPNKSNTTPDHLVRVKGKVVEEEKTFLDRLSEVLFKAKPKDVKDHIVNNILIPKAIDTFLEADRSGWAMLLNGVESVAASKKSDKPYRSYEPYDKRYEEPRYSRPRSSGYDVKMIHVESREEAEMVIDDLNNYIHDYGFASVSYFYSLVDIEPDWAGEKWGWDERLYKDDCIKHIVDGYLIKLPRPREISSGRR